MSLRYYWISAFIVLGLTVVISVATQKRGKGIAIVFIQVLTGFLCFTAFMVGLVKLLVFLGIAQQGFKL